MISPNQINDRYLDLLINCLTDNIFKIDDISDEWRKTGGKNYMYAYTMTALPRMKHTKLVVEEMNVINQPEPFSSFWEKMS